ncbi:MAG: hypothetical protein EHM24_29985 [Acidobacteria bacterium]|nr:MAG: hypothetical protein EHM24_29985 [Acidobacteriota bacterium]
MIALIKDLDNPFGYYERRGAGSTQDVSLKPVRETVARLRALCEMREVGGETGETESAEPALGEVS